MASNEDRIDEMAEREDSNAERTTFLEDRGSMEVNSDSLWKAFRDALERSDHQLAGEMVLLALEEMERALDEARAVFAEAGDSP